MLLKMVVPSNLQFQTVMFCDAVFDSQGEAFICLIALVGMNKPGDRG